MFLDLFRVKMFISIWNLGVDQPSCGMCMVDQHRRRSLGGFLAVSVTTIEATKREP